MENKIGVMKKLTLARKMLKDRDLKKSGNNKYAGFSYFELADFLSEINEINNMVGLVTVFEMGKEECCLKVYDVEDASYLSFNVDRVDAEMNKAQKVQVLGATQTYMRRYCYLSAYEISECDTVDALPQQEIGTEPKKEIAEDDKKEKAISVIKEMCEKSGLTYDVERLKKMSAKELTEEYKILKGE